MAPGLARLQGVSWCSERSRDARKRAPQAVSSLDRSCAQISTWPPPLRYRWFADSPLEGDGFELMVRRHESRAFPSIPGIAGGSSTTALPSRRASMSLPDARTHPGLSEWSDHLIWSWTKYRSVASDVMPSAVPGNEDALSVAPREVELEGSGPR